MRVETSQCSTTIKLTREDVAKLEREGSMEVDLKGNFLVAHVTITVDNKP
jgi:hypothetical protein